MQGNTWKLTEICKQSLRKIPTTKSNYFPNIMSATGQNFTSNLEEEKVASYNPDHTKENNFTKTNFKPKTSNQLILRSTRVMPPVGFYEAKAALTQRRAKDCIILLEKGNRPKTRLEEANKNDQNEFYTKFVARPWKKPSAKQESTSSEKTVLPPNVIEKIIGKKYKWNLHNDFDHKKDQDFAIEKYNELKERLKGRN